MEGGLFDLVVLPHAVDGVEVRDFEGKDVDGRGAQDELVLGSDAGLLRVEKGQKLPRRRLHLLLPVVLLLRVFLFVLLFALVLPRVFRLAEVILRTLHLHTEVSHFLLVPVKSDRNVVSPQVITHKGISL